MMNANLVLTAEQANSGKVKIQMTMQTASVRLNPSNLQLETAYRECFRHVVAVLVDRYRLSESDALDIASNTFVEVFYAGSTIYDPNKAENPCAWLIQRALFRAKDFFRKRERQERLLKEFVGTKDLIITQEENRRHNNRERLINALTGDLKVLCELLVMGYTAKQIASILETTEQEIRKRQRRMIRELTLLVNEIGFSREDLLS